MDKNQIIEYVLNSPENTNPAILGQMIDEVVQDQAPEPSGTIRIGSDGNYNVTNYAQANVQVTPQWKGSVKINNKESRGMINIQYYNNEGKYISQNIAAGNSLTIPARTVTIDDEDIRCRSKFLLTSGALVTMVTTGAYVSTTTIEEAGPGQVHSNLVFVDIDGYFKKDVEINVSIQQSLT